MYISMINWSNLIQSLGFFFIVIGIIFFVSTAHSELRDKADPSVGMGLGCGSLILGVILLVASLMIVGKITWD